MVTSRLRRCLKGVQSSFFGADAEPFAGPAAEPFPDSVAEVCCDASDVSAVDASLQFLPVTTNMMDQMSKSVLAEIARLSAHMDTFKFDPPPSR